MSFRNTPTDSIRTRLAILNFLQYAVWGAYLTSMGNYLAIIGLAEKIWIFYAVPGFVSIFTPTIAGMISDRFLPAQKTLSICHLTGGITMLAIFLYCKCASPVSFGPLFALFSINVAFYMPTLALNNSVGCICLEKAGLDPVKAFPPIRMWGTVGFVASMLLSNFIRIDGVQFQNSQWQFLSSGVFAFILSLYALVCIPACPVDGKNTGGSLADRMGLSAFSLFKDRDVAKFFVFSMLLGASLQITNGYANSYVSSFASIPQYAGSWGAHNANALISISQISEAACILLIPFFLKRYGIKTVLLISMSAWVIRFGCFALGNPGDGVWLIILSCIVYGVAFDFFNIASCLHINNVAPSQMRSQAQGLFYLMTNGLGSSLGVFVAGKVVNKFVYIPQAAGLQGNWQQAWLCFAAYALVVAVMFLIVFPSSQKKTSAKA